MLHAFTDVYSLKPNTLLFPVLTSHWNEVQETINMQHRYTMCVCVYTPYILKSNPHPFYSFRGLKNQMQIRFAVVSWILEK